MTDKLCWFRNVAPGENMAFIPDDNLTLCNVAMRKCNDPFTRTTLYLARGSSSEDSVALGTLSVQTLERMSVDIKLAKGVQKRARMDDGENGRSKREKVDEVGTSRKVKDSNQRSEGKNRDPREGPGLAGLKSAGPAANSDKNPSARGCISIAFRRVEAGWIRSNSKDDAAVLYHFRFAWVSCGGASRVSSSISAALAEQLAEEVAAEDRVEVSDPWGDDHRMDVNANEASGWSDLGVPLLSRGVHLRALLPGCLLPPPQHLNLLWVSTQALPGVPIHR
ncbi:uncharacterized protein C8R40DRAFT_1068866 [Lentinula edodes]|uniref:uncharacterized protein n=1 Tax=Lentinula edodes TaxID=5353 RepID=UPI001E8D12F6|nr:uncharacterized protein C8R40DRAFT_1068866 [Lentinula edodes]KAH7876062.1 hypothetical protein C8R40DRAFT_1068866 [Lentinula edodes]